MAALNEMELENAAGGSIDPTAKKALGTLGVLGAYAAYWLIFKSKLGFNLDF